MDSVEGKMEIIKVLRSRARKSGQSIPIGTVFTGSIGPATNKIFLKAYGLIINLENPMETWPSPEVDNYEELDATLTVNSK